MYTTIKQTKRHPSIHLLLLIWPGRGGSSLSREAHTFLSSATLSSCFGRILRCSQVSQETSSLQHVLGLLGDLLLEGRALNTSPGRCPRGILTGSPSHLTWLFSMQWRSSSICARELALLCASSCCAWPQGTHHCAPPPGLALGGGPGAPRLGGGSHEPFVFVVRRKEVAKT